MVLTFQYNVILQLQIPAQVAFKNCAPFITHITKINRRTIDDAEDLDFVMSMYNQLVYNSDYSEITGSLWFYSNDETTNIAAGIEGNNTFKSFKYKTKLIG